MNDFLDQVWLDNTIRSYLIVAIIILFVVIVKKYVAHSLAAIIFHFIKRIWKDVDRKSFTSLVSKPLGFFLAIFVAIVTLHKLKFPHQLDVDIYRLTLKELIHTIASLVLIISFIRLLLRIIDFIAIILHIRADRTHDTTDNQLVIFFKDFFKVVIGIIGLLMILKYTFGYQITNLLTGLSIVGAAIALALRESLENLIASFIIFFDKPFSMGDVVKIQSFTGTVEKIGLRSTRIRTDQKTFITVPNKQMVDGILDNLSLRSQRKAELRLEVGLSTPSPVLEELIAGIRKITSKTEIENSTVLLNDITSSAFVILVDYFTGPVTQAEFNKIKEEVNFEILKLMEGMKVEIAGASTDVRIANQQ
ncbi:mechanosensitive ion channel family protein [Terrimonas pollutisoli]|uniref:mechanosensitive ion channel family protein n=1 Tax=Terrimonas pollutisoli TaxID=3034147 RepID=UPI0023ECB8EF|nr:mechanosensitive ion channel domain-containing protein [Terrimonas sp. H1YJ31]